MSRRAKLTATAVLVTAAAAIPGAALASGSAPEPETPITGPAFDRAAEAAVGHLGEGRVTATEVGDEESYYEVEVALDDGSQIDVQLDESFTVVGTEADGPEED